MTHWEIYLVLTLTALGLWRCQARFLRALAIASNLFVVACHALALSNVGRNTFEHVTRGDLYRDTFRDGVFAEAKAAEAAARERIPGVCFAALCLGALALWPAVAKRRQRPSPE